MKTNNCPYISYFTELLKSENMKAKTRQAKYRFTDWMFIAQPKINEPKKQKRAIEILDRKERLKKFNFIFNFEK